MGICGPPLPLVILVCDDREGSARREKWGHKHSDVYKVSV